MSERKLTSIGVKPVSDRVIVEPMARDQKTKSGILLPESDVPVLKGTIRAVGVKTEEVNVGDDVLFSSLSGSPYKIGDKDYLMMRENDIMAII